MTDSATGGPRANSFDHPGLARVADGVAAAVAVSLPWSTSATGILVVVWFVTLLPTLDTARMRREIATPAGGAPLILVALAVLGMAWADVGMSQRLDGIGGFLKLLFIPFLLAQFRGSTRGWWVIFGFLGASVALLVLSWGLALIPGLAPSAANDRRPSRTSLPKRRLPLRIALRLRRRYGGAGGGNSHWREFSSLRLSLPILPSLTAHSTTIAVVGATFGFWRAAGEEWRDRRCRLRAAGAF
jgi:hypothetical protein